MGVFQTLMESLRSRGWTHKLLQARLASDGVDVGQATLSDIATGKNQNPNYWVGSALRALEESGECPAADQPVA